MGTYGRSFTLSREEKNGLQAPAPQKGMAGPYTREPGSLGYNEICESFRKEKWTVVNDPYHLAPYAYRERQWVGYDDIESIALKARIAVNMNLGGGMVWSIETDDFLGECHGVKFPLIQTINKVFATEKNPVIPTPPPTVDKGDDDENENGIPSSTSSTSSSTWWPQSSSTTSTTPSPSTQSSTSTQPSSTQPSSGSTLPWWQTTFNYDSSTTSTTTQGTIERELTTKRVPSSSTPSWERENENNPSSSTTQKPSSTTSSWWTWTTPSTTITFPTSAPPTRPPPDGSGINCKFSGMFRNPNDCKKFYRCVDFGIENRFMVYDYSCPTDTVFDEASKLCLWPTSVPECADYYTPGGRSAPSTTSTTASPGPRGGGGNEVEREDRSLFKASFLEFAFP